MFTIKFTYRGQIRKYTFSETNTFPAYDEICDQLNRVFSIPRAFYLSKLLFSPDAAQPSRILIGKEVHGAYDYHKCIKQFKDRTWPHGLLRFTVCDALSSAADNGPSFSSSAGSILSQQSDSRHRGIFMSRLSSLGLNHTATQVPMDVDVRTPTLRTSVTDHIHAQPNQTTPQHRGSDTVTGSCCSISQGKAEIRAMLTEFKEVLDRVVVHDLSTHEQHSPEPEVSMEAPPPSLCSICTRNIVASRTGLSMWYSCESCHVVVCDACHHHERPGFCLNLMGPHQMKFATAILNRHSRLPIPRLPAPWTPRSMPPSSGFANAPFIPASALNPGPPAPTTAAPVSETRPPPAASTATPAAPIIHRGVVCDVCNSTIEGVRHKCLDCQDYDLCTGCMSVGCAEAHNPFHEFFDITEPGRVVVHTVFSGNGERETPRESRTVSASTAPVESVTHMATCDLCDSRIVGDRYKCLNCPDFDTCSPCFSITGEQHPKHAFVRIRKQEDYLRLRVTPRQMHYATCNGCSKAIYGLRFKCMHPDCPDYDLCENCESLPISVHPDNHPMLKMKAPESVIPTVYRVGQRNLIPQPMVPSYQAPIVSDRIEESNMTFALRRSPSPRQSPPRSVHEDRVKTPKPISRASSGPTSFFQDVPAPRSASPIEPPPIPPKPEMISHASWASIPGFYGSSDWESDGVLQHDYVPESPAFNFSKASLRNPFADIPIPDTPVTQTANQGQPDARSEAMNATEISLPSVPSHTPNPWPTTNPAERQELLQLIADFAGPTTSPNVLNAFSAPTASQEMKAVDERRSLVDLFASELLTPTVPPPPPSVRLVDCTLPVNPYLHIQADSTHPMVGTADAIVTSNEPAKFSGAPSVVESGEKQDEPMSLGFADFSMSHLLQGLEQQVASLKAVVEATGNANSVADSSVSGEPLLNRPSPKSTASSSPIQPRRSLADLITELPSLIPVKPQNVKGKEEAPEVRIPLSAAFVEDVTVPDGQEFPPGAEFMKCWRLFNDSDRDWPESTELVFVAGESLSAEKASTLTVALGKVSAGAEIDVWTGELKAPDAPGRYVGYWRLRSDGEVFGSSLWIEINVVEANSHSSDESMASSSIIMPSASSATHIQQVGSTTVRSVSAPTSVLSTEDNISDAGSDISLISMPSSPSDSEDEALWHDSRSQTTAELAAAAASGAAGNAANNASAIDYVMLYDDNSSSEE
ncbi:hypothetical protein GALMADRAFT_234824 [Galerina marginata CBS 339.88]|uniref:ZZ-type domain-containing protein n=1 Tax=Galerina marginata (strain CBS 339.88) TaxID=685588 RepID=A0A067U2X6_GALM3|nr:hypothetical protein GALMADRAFT_234824 [Galerina marginata CBS 339.88]